MTSVNIGVSQNNTSQPGQDSLALSGSGSSSGDFSWGTQAGAFTKGEINVGQSFGAAVQPQGIGIDDFSMLALLDSDGDQLSDEEELALGTNPAEINSDGDGQDDFFEHILAKTDPRSGSSFFKLDLIVDSSGLITTSIPTDVGRTYFIESSTDLETWDQSEGFEGDGDPWGLIFPQAERMFFRARIKAP